QMSVLQWFTMLTVMTMLLSTTLGDTSVTHHTFTLADTLRPPGPPIEVVPSISAPQVTAIERQGRLRGPFLNPRGPPPLRIHHPRALLQPPPLLPPQPLFTHHDGSSNTLEVNPELRKVLKDISMADLPLAGEGENQLPGFFAPEFNNRFTPDENAPIIPVTSTTQRIPITQQTTPQLSNQLPLTDSNEARPLFPPFGPESNQLPLTNPREPRPLFPPFGPESNQLPLTNSREPRPLFPPFGSEQSASELPTFHIVQTTTIGPILPPVHSNQQSSSLVPDTLRSIFPSFDEAHFGSQFPQFSPNPPSPTTPEILNFGVTEQFFANSDQTINPELPNQVNPDFQDPESFELSNEFPPRLNNNNHALEDDEFFNSQHITGLRPPLGHPSNGVIRNIGGNRRPPKTVNKPLPNGALRQPNKNQGQFVTNNGRVPRQLQRRPQQHAPRGPGNNNGRRPLDHRRQRVRAAPPSGHFRPGGRRPGRLPRLRPWHQIRQ
ncbi:unnamed protein product, partial [Meganyctiphanes norvegica]